MPSSEGVEKLKIIQKEIEFIFSQGEIRAALKDEGKRRAIFHAIIEIKENIRVLQENGESELLSLFDEQDIRKIAATRNFAAHNSKEINPNIVANLVRFNLFDIKARIDEYFSEPSSANADFAGVENENNEPNFSHKNSQKVILEPVSRRNFSIIALIFLLFVVIFAVLGFVIHKMLPNSDTSSVSAHTNLQVALKTPAKVTQNDMIYPLDPFTLNLLADGGARYIKLTIFFEFAAEYDSKALDRASAKIRDKIIRIISAKTFEQMRGAEGKDKIAQEIKAAINKMLGIQIERGV